MHARVVVTTSNLWADYPTSVYTTKYRCMAMLQFVWRRLKSKEEEPINKGVGPCLMRRGYKEQSAVAKALDSGGWTPVLQSLAAHSGQAVTLADHSPVLPIDLNRAESADHSVAPRLLEELIG